MSAPVGKWSVFGALSADRAQTVMEVAERACGRDAWEQRMNVRNRLYELELEGQAICDDERPQRWARPSLAVAP